MFHNLPSKLLWSSTKFLLLTSNLGENNIKLFIKDNGTGYIPDNSSSGFGIKMVIDFAKKLESSKIEFIINDGTEFILDFKI